MSQQTEQNGRNEAHHHHGSGHRGGHPPREGAAAPRVFAYITHWNPTGCASAMLEDLLAPADGAERANRPRDPVGARSARLPGGRLGRFGRLAAAERVGPGQLAVDAPTRATSVVPCRLHSPACSQRLPGPVEPEPAPGRRRPNGVRPGGARPETRRARTGSRFGRLGVERDESVGLQLGHGDVLGGGRVRPAELGGDVPGGGPGDPIAEQADAQRRHLLQQGAAVAARAFPAADAAKRSRRAYATAAPPARRAGARRAR
jgi:hypothetical protein